MIPHSHVGKTNAQNDNSSGEDPRLHQREHFGNKGKFKTKRQKKSVFGCFSSACFPPAEFMRFKPSPPLHTKSWL